MLPFVPRSSQLVAVTSTSQPLRVDKNHHQMYIANASADQVVFVSFGNTSSITAVANSSMAVLPGAFFVINKGAAEYIALVGSGSANCYVSLGSGA